MSALARFLVEFEPSPAPSQWSPPAPDLSAPSGSLDDDGAALGLDGDMFAIAEGPGIDDLEQDGGLGFAADDAGAGGSPLADTSVADAIAAAVATAEAGFSERIAMLEEEHARARAEDRLRWTQYEGLVLAEAFRKATGDIEEHLVDAVAAVLQPLVSDIAKSTALRELRHAIATLMTGGSTAKIDVAGPEDLLEALRAALAASGSDTSGMTFVPSSDAEVTVTADNSTIRSRLAEWAASFETSLGSDA